MNRHKDAVKVERIERAAKSLSSKQIWSSGIRLSMRIRRTPVSKVVSMASRKKARILREKTTQQ